MFSGVGGGGWDEISEFEEALMLNSEWYDYQTDREDRIQNSR